MPQNGKMTAWPLIYIPEEKMTERKQFGGGDGKDLSKRPTNSKKEKLINVYQ